MRWQGLVALHVIQCLAVVYVACSVLALDLPAPPWRSIAETPTKSHEGDKHASPRAEHTVGNMAIGIEDSSPAYGRLVVMLVDALREDFVHNRSEMRYVRQLLREEPQRTASFVSDANTPTVTMPRIKALTTGGVPRFIDVMNNLDSKSLTQDNLIDRFYMSNRKLVMYGDETWLKLFPRQFMRADGTSSFFTKDFTEVDDNVTRHLAEDFDPTMQHPASQDWDIAILHYLGLDHIGHTLGPSSPQLGIKLTEMDRIFEELHRSLRQQDRLRAKQRCSSMEESRAQRQCDMMGNALPTLLLLLSDHGMNKVGNHGGASIPETSAFMMFSHVGAHPPAYANTHEEVPKSAEAGMNARHHMAQVDLVPTLGSLFGVGIPESSVGNTLYEPFEILTDSRDKQRRYEAALRENAAHLEALMDQDAPYLYDEELKATRATSLANFVQKAHSKIYTARLGSSVGDETGAAKESVKLATAVGALGTICIFGFANLVRWREVEYPALTLFGVILIHTLSLTSSSAIENEHVVWNFFLLSWLIGRFFMDIRECKRNHKLSAQINFAFPLGVVLLRLLRERLMVINFAKIAGQDDEGNFVDEGTAVLVLNPKLYMPCTISFFLLAYFTGSVYRIACLTQLSKLCAFFATSTILIAGILLASLKIQELPREMTVFGLNELWRARAAYACVFSMVSLAIKTRSRTPNKKERMIGNRDSWELGMLGLEVLLLLLHRNTSTVIICGAIAVTRAFAFWQELIGASPSETLLLQWIIGQCIFFALGNSHVVSTVDISGAYTGLSDYNQYLVGILTFVITFTGPILGLANATRNITIQYERTPTTDQASALNLFLVCAGWRITLASAVLVAMRTHLFIWSVFAPKWMLETMLFFFQIAAGLVLRSSFCSSHLT